MLAMPVCEIANALADERDLSMSEPCGRRYHRVTCSARELGGTDIGSETCESPLGGLYEMMDSIHVRIDQRDPGSVEEFLER